MAFYFYLSTKIIMVFITKSYQDLFGVRSYINACKNLFLCNKRQEYFMLMLPADKKLSAKNVARQIGSPHLSFASAEDMERLLHTYPGAVSVLSLIYDKEKRVQLLIDKGLMNVTYIGCHPCTNTCSLKIKMEDILTVWLPATGHDDMKVIE